MNHLLILLQTEQYSHDRDRFAENLKYYRKEKGLTQFAFSEKAGLTEVTIKRVDTCKQWPSEEKNWLILVESVTSHGHVDSKRYIELKDLFSSVNADLIFISAFPDKSTFIKFAHDIAWESEVWIANNPDHIIHFNGDKFMGPHKA